MYMCIYLYIYIYIYVYIHIHIYGMCIWDMYTGGVGSLNTAVATHLPRNPRICAYKVCKYIHMYIYVCSYMKCVYGMCIWVYIWEE